MASTSEFSTAIGNSDDSEIDSSLSEIDSDNLDLESPTKGLELADKLEDLNKFTPTIPDYVISHYAQSCGISIEDPVMIRFISLATQNFVANIVNDALQYRKINDAGHNKKALSDKKYTLTCEDLLPALEEHGIKVCKPQYFM